MRCDKEYNRDVKRGAKNMVMYNIDLRIEKGVISSKRLANQLGLDRTTIARWFNNSEMDEVKRGIVLKAIKEIKEAEHKEK